LILLEKWINETISLEGFKMYCTFMTESNSVLDKRLLLRYYIATKSVLKTWPEELYV
jgi:hypothetical protein